MIVMLLCGEIVLSNGISAFNDAENRVHSSGCADPLCVLLCMLAHRLIQFKQTLNTFKGRRVCTEESKTHAECECVYVSDRPPPVKAWRFFHLQHLLFFL